MGSSAAYLDSGFLQLSRLRTQARQQLVDLLGSSRGKKLLILDKQVGGCLGLIAEISLFREHGVEQLQYLSADLVDIADVRSVVFVVRTNIRNTQLVIQQIKHSLWSNKSCQILVYFLPHRSIVCERMFQEEGILADVSIREFPLYCIPLDSDLLSLELDGCFKDVVLNLDWSNTLYTAQGLMEIQQLFGPVPVLKGIGAAAEAVANNLSRLIETAEAGVSPLGISNIDEMILVDRTVDTMTPMCTQLTYEGLLDEVLGIKNGSVSLDKEGGGKQRIPLNSSDGTFQYIRDKHVGAIGSWLNEQARSFHSGYKGSKAAELKELKEFTSKLKTLPQIQRHIELLTSIQASSGKGMFKERVSLEQELLDDAVVDPACQFVEDMMHREEPFETVVRMMCLISLTQGGIPKKLHDTLYKEALHTYGHQHILTFQRLHSAGLLRSAKGGLKSNFQAIKKGLNLVVDGVDPGQPSDPAYVFSGYAPISVRLVQSALREPAWSGVPDEIWKMLPAQHFTRQLWKDLPKPTHKGRRKRALVVFIGGVTHAEIAALRFLQTQPSFNADLVFATTDFVNGTTLQKSFQNEAVLAASERNLLSQ